jgi:hypothetical protein
VVRKGRDAEKQQTGTLVISLQKTDMVASDESPAWAAPRRFCLGLLPVRDEGAAFKRFPPPWQPPRRA